MKYFKDTGDRFDASILKRETQHNNSAGNAMNSNARRRQSRRKNGDLVGRSLRGLALMLTLFVTATLIAQPGPDPLQKTFDAIGGKDALLEVKGFSYESSGERFESGEGLTPAAPPIKASSFELSLFSDVENDRLSFDWQRQIFDPLRGELTYRDVIDGDAGYQTGNDSVFNPPDARSDRALVSERIAALRREFRLLNPHLYLRMVALDEKAATIKADVQLDGRRHHVIELFDEVWPVELFVDAETGQLSKVQTLENDYIWGDVLIAVTYSDWWAPEDSLLTFPHQVELALAGTTLRTAVRANVVVNPDFRAGAFALPDEPRTQVDQGAAERAGLSSQYIARWHAIGVPNGDQDQTSVVAWIGAEMEFALSQAVASGDTLEHRPSECGHCVQDFLAELDLRDLPGEAAGLESAADDTLPTADLRFYPAALVVPCGHLPGHAAVAADLSNMAIPNGWIPRRLRSDRCVLWRRYNHIQGLPIPFPQQISCRRSIIGAVSQKARDRGIELIQEPG